MKTKKDTSLADTAKNERYALNYLLDNVDRIYCYEKTGIIKHASTGYGADILYEANHRAICEEYEDLFDYGILEEKSGSIIVYIDRKHHDPDRMQELYDLLYKLDSYPVVDESLYSDMEYEAQQEFIEGEIRSFIRHLDISPDYQFLFDNDLITTDTLTGHIWQLINDNNLEFEMSDSAWIDIKKIAKLSSLYQLGYSESNKLDEVITKVETTSILKPSLSSVLSGLLADLQSIAYDNKPASDQLSYV